MKKECKIVQDLLPSYVDKLTNEETNQYIEEHLKECKECKAILKNMKSNIEYKEQDDDRKKVKYFKKYKNKLTILKTIISIIIALWAVFVARNTIIVNQMAKRANETINRENYHITSYKYGIESYKKEEVFVLGDKRKVITTQYIDGKLSETITIGKKAEKDSYGTQYYLVNIYSNSENGKKAITNQKMGMVEEFSQPGWYENENNLLKTIYYSKFAVIKNEKYNKKNCYYIFNYKSPYNFYINGMVIDKETGLMIGSALAGTNNEPDNQESNCVYEFNNVTDKDFIEPDINQYEVIENI